MHILVIWTWYVWLTHGTCLAEIGHTVTCIDIDSSKIDALLQWNIPIYEPGLQELVQSNIAHGRLRFWSQLDRYINTVDIIFIAVWTPPWKDWHADLQYVRGVAQEIGEKLEKYCVIVNKSTVPVGTGDIVASLIQDKLTERWVSFSFDVVSNPEFLKEWTAVEDFFHGDRIVIGCNNPDGKALHALEQLYSPLTETVILKTNLYTAEIIKYGANALLAVEVSFINRLSQLCEKVWADVTLVSEGLKLDKRIGKKAFLNAGPWFGGSCFPKDVMEFAQTFQDYGLPNGILEATLDINEQQKRSIFEKVQRLVPDLSRSTISILWVAFKADTDDIRYASSLVVVDALLAAWATIKIYDPHAMKNFEKFYPTLTYTENVLTCVQDSDCIVLLTDRNEFKAIDRSAVAQRVHQKNLVDARNLYTKAMLDVYDFTYIGIGR